MKPVPFYFGNGILPKASRFTFIILFSLIFSLIINWYFPTSPYCSIIDNDQRERISEIDEELGQLRKKKKKAGGSQKINITGVRHFTNKNYARVVFDLTSLPTYRVEEGGESKVYRVVLKNTGLLIIPPDCKKEPNQGLLKCVSVRKLADSIYVNIFPKNRSKIKVFDLTGPPRIVVDLFKKGSGLMPEGSSSHPAIKNVPAKERKINVVLDPGHGGKDPGAIGPRGLKEKNVVLKISKKLKRYFNKDKRFKVYLTRKGDHFLTLEKRTAIANGAGADIFISIHTNASRKRSARGISSFVLGKKATDREALELAMVENGVVLENDSKVNYILRDLINYGKGNESLKLAKVINDEIVKKVRAKRKRVLDLGVKKAPFYVLYGAAMPAVLVETSFITNSYEEQLLAKDWYLDLIARSIYKGITDYIDRSKMALYGESGQ